MLGMKDAIKRIYNSTEDCFFKHSILFVLTGITSIFSVALNEFSKQKEIDPSNWIWAMLGVLFLIILSIYIVGYSFNIMHNSFDENKNDILPEFDKSNIATFNKAFPLMFVWFLYIMFFIIGGTILGLFLGKELMPIIVVAIGIFVGILGIFLQFVYVRFSKYFEKRGLFKITLPFKYIKPTFGSLFKLWIKFIPLFILNVILGALAEGNSLFAYIFTAISGYISCVSGFIYSFCIVQIYKEKVEPFEDYE